MFAEPLADRRQVSVREHKTKVDWAAEMGALMQGRHATCAKVIIACDHLNTRTVGMFYRVFKLRQEQAIASRIDFRSTPGHGSWLNIAENETSRLASH